MKDWKTLAGLVSLVLMMLVVPPGVQAQQIEFGSTINPVGSGARAMGMGGAFISVADDATAASWNPAGLVHLEKPEVSFVYGYSSRNQAYSSTTHPEMESSNDMNASGVNYASVAYPFVLFDRNMIVSLNYQRLYDMNKDIALNYNWQLSTGTLNDRINFTQRGYLYTVSPAFAVQLHPRLYIGMTANFWVNQDNNGWENTYTSNPKGTLHTGSFDLLYNSNIYWTNKYTFRGTNYHLGLFSNVYGPFTVGVVYKTTFNAKLTQDATFTETVDTSIPALNWSDHAESTTHTSENLTMKVPASYGAGISYRHSDAWTVAFDAYKTEWSKFVITDSQGNQTNPIDGAPISEGKLEDTVQFRLGTEYLFIMDKQVVPVRFGLFYDPEPQKGSRDIYRGFTVGTGYALKWFAVDAAYQYRYGSGVKGDVSMIPGTTVDVKQHTVLMSAIVYFK